MKNSFIIIGIAVAGVYPLFSFIGLEEHAMIMVILTILVGTFTMAIYGQRYKNKLPGKGGINRKRTIGLSLLFITISMLVIGFVFYGVQAPDFQIRNGQLKITGIYGITTEVSSIEVRDEMPKILRKTNGFNYNSARKGNFKLEGLGQCKLYLQSQDGPFIYVKANNGKIIIINAETSEETRLLAEKLMTQQGN
jgi:predicted membrane channel-forming protein YqfA (hemolysin III family)